MTIADQLNKIAALAYLELDDKSKTQLTADIQVMMNFIEELRAINTEVLPPFSILTK